MGIAAYMGENITREQVEDMIQVFSLDYQKQLAEWKNRPRNAPKMPKPQPPGKMTEEDFIAVMHRTLGKSDEQAEEDGGPSGQTAAMKKSPNEMMFYQKSMF